MSNDYTLPPVPIACEGWSVPAQSELRTYGHACAEAARAPLLARIAELEDLAEKLRLANAEWRPLVESREAQIDRLRAELAAKAGEVEALRDCLAECLDDLSSEINARALGELPRRIERDLEPVRRAAALLAQPAGTWVNPLAAEVEALRNVERRARDVVAYDWSDNDDDAVLAVQELRDSVEAHTAAIDARKGEGSEG